MVISIHIRSPPGGLTTGLTVWYNIYSAEDNLN